MRINIRLAGVQLTALCDTGSQATLINEMTHRGIGFLPLQPNQITLSCIGRSEVLNIGFFQDFTEIQNAILPAKIHVLKDDTIPLDTIIGIDFLLQTQFTFDKDGIRLCSSTHDDTLVNAANVLEDQTSQLDLSQILNSELRQEDKISLFPTNQIKLKTLKLK